MCNIAHVEMMDLLSKSKAASQEGSQKCGAPEEMWLSLLGERHEGQMLEKTSSTKLSEEVHRSRVSQASAVRGEILKEVLMLTSKQKRGCERLSRKDDGLEKQPGCCFSTDRVRKHRGGDKQIQQLGSRGGLPLSVL